MYLVIGSNGQLGTKVKNILGNQGFYSTREDLDITNIDQLNKIVKENNFKAIINCSAYTTVDKAEMEFELAQKINVDGVRNLAKTGLPLIHISTDYVFDGKNNVPYIENDKTNPLSVYGKTKLDGENEIIKYSNNYIIIRTSWLYSQYRNNFLKTMLKLGKERESLNVVFDQVGTPTYAKDLAEVIISILPQFKKDTKEIYHFSNEGVCSWYDFAVEIMKQANLQCKINPIESKDYATPVKRPNYSVFNKAKIKKDFGIKINHWRESLVECLKTMENK